MHLSPGYNIHYSARPDDHHSGGVGGGGVGIITSRSIHSNLLELKPIREKTTKARYSSAYAKLTTIVCYAQTEVAKDTFYDSLQMTVDGTPRHDALLTKGDLNTSQINQRRQGKYHRSTTMGKDLLHVAK